VPDLDAYKVQLLPQVVLIAVSMLTLLVSPGFEWAYPVRVVVVGLVLLQFWPRFQWQRPQWLLPAAVGTAVFGLWLVMVPVDPVLSSRFAQTLWSVPTGWALAWIVLRVLGASVIVPLAEELAFRGAAFQLLADALHKLPRPIPARVQAGLVLLLSSLAFGALHGDWLAATLAGLAYGVLRLRSGRVSDAVLAHGVTNFLLALYIIDTKSWSLW
jgi:CAAX prenyl protease-like protein